LYFQVYRRILRVLVKEMLRRGCSLSEPAHRERGLTVDKASIDYGEYREAQDHPHACMDGYVYLGYTDEDGEEAVEALPCRRCREGE
jgi:hypothetical protein